jgi:hypothetical protein
MPVQDPREGSRSLLAMPIHDLERDREPEGLGLGSRRRMTWMMML